VSRSDKSDGELEKGVVAADVCVMEREKFISNEIWMLTFSAAFQRAYIYSGGTEVRKKAFKNHLKSFIDNELLSKYKDSVNDEEHLKSILSLIEESKKYKDILTNGSINFGISQKILNLYLKYRWCLKDIHTPPHFPVDRRIQENIKYKHLFSWTQLSDSKKYMELIEHVRGVVQKSNQYKSIAEFELIHFDRKLTKEK